MNTAAAPPGGGELAEAALLRAWSALVEALPNAAWVVQAGSLVIAVANDSARTMLRCEALVGVPGDTLLATPEDIAYWAEVRAGHDGPLLSDAVLSPAAGVTLHVTRSIRPVCLPGSRETSHYVVMLCDRSEWRRSEEEREEVLAELQATLESTADGILVTDPFGRIRAFNRLFAQIWGIPAALLQAHRDDAVHEWMCRAVHDSDAYRRRLSAIQAATLLSATERLTLRSGRVLERATRPLWRRGQTAGRVYSFRDLTERLAADQRIETLSLTDALTGLPNRRQLTDGVAAASLRARRDGGTLALLLLDLDRFRQINESFGHETGDRVLVDIVHRIQGCVRQGDLVARIGGDQFALLVRDADRHAAEATARRVLDAVAAPCHIDGTQFTITCSIGGALCPDNGLDADELLRHAEAAMRAVKDGGRASYRVHQGRKAVDWRAHMQLDHAMRLALPAGRFRLHFQPQVELLSGRTIAAEALIRWRDPDLGEVPPARLIPVAEDTGFIIALGDWVLAQAVRQCMVWLEQDLRLPVAVNVSALQFGQADFVDRIGALLGESGLPPALLELELTESILVRDADEALQRLRALAALGVRLAIDDFGTGYSSLSYLKRFPIHKLKIDRSFVQGLPDDDSDAAIVRAIVQMARALGKTVIAEGVETEAQRRFLAHAGCEEFQGFLCAPALDVQSFEQRLQQPLPALQVVRPPMRRVR